MSRKKPPKMANYLILWSKHEKLEPGDIVRNLNVGEILFVNNMVSEHGKPKTETIAIGVRVLAIKVPAVIKTLVSHYKDSETIAELTGLDPEQVREAIVLSLKKIASILKQR